MIADALLVFLILAIVVFGSIRLEERWKVGRMLGSALLAIVLAALLANLGLLPSSSATYDMLGGIGVNLGIALILLGVDVRSVVSAGPRMLAAFALGSAGTIAGAFVGTLALHRAIGGEAWKLAGQYTGTYIGGGVNMVAVGRGLDTSADVFSAAIAADNVTTALWMVVCFALPGVVGRRWLEGRAARARDVQDAVTTVEHTFTNSLSPVSLANVAALVTLAAAAVWASEAIAARVPGIPAVLWLTTIVLIAAQVGPVRRLPGGPLGGNYILQLFLASLGAQSIVGEIVRVGPAVFYFTVVVVMVHGVLLFGVGRLVRLDLPTLAVASQANVGGPASAMALATARGYSDHLLPGIAVGLLGYAVGNYAGFAVAGLVRTWVGA